MSEARLSPFLNLARHLAHVCLPKSVAQAILWPYGVLHHVLYQEGGLHGRACECRPSIPEGSAGSCSPQPTASWAAALLPGCTAPGAVTAAARQIPDGALPACLEDGNSPSSSRRRRHLALNGLQERIDTECCHLAGAQYLCYVLFLLDAGWHTQRHTHSQGCVLHQRSDTNGMYHRTVVLNKQFMSTSTENFFKNVLDLLSQNHQGTAGAYEYRMYLFSI